MYKVNIYGDTKVRIIFILCLSILFLSACEMSLANKQRTEELLLGNTFYKENKKTAAIKAYEYAVNSPSPVISAKAAYELALIALENNDNNKHISYLERSVELGNISAKMPLAKAYIYISKKSEHIEKAKKLLRSMTDNSNNANIELFLLAEKEKNDKEALIYGTKAKKLLLKRLKEKDNPDGSLAIKMARLFYKHNSLPVDYNKAEYWYRIAIAKGNDKAALELAKLWQNTRSRENVDKDTFNLMLQAAITGNDKATKYIAKAYRNGYGIDKDLEQAWFWYEKIKKEEEKNLKSLELDVAYMYMNKKDLEQSRAVFEKAADHGALPAMLMLDSWTNTSQIQYKNVYKNATQKKLLSILKDHEEAYSIEYPELIHRQYRIVAEIGSGMAALRIAKDYKIGRVVTANQKKAQEWYHKAADFGEVNAMMIIARSYLLETEKKENIEKAFKWFKRAAEAGEVEGQYQIGIFYARGYGVEKDMQKSQYWMEKAKKNGYDLAVELPKFVDEAQDNKDD